MAPDVKSTSLNSGFIHTASRPLQSIPSRRRLLKFGILAAASCLAPSLTWANAPNPNPSSPERLLAFHNLHTGERLRTVYWQEGTYIPEALADIDHILRDHRTNDVVSIDLGLLNLLHTLQQKLDTNEPFHIISGYRSPKTNAMLRRHTRGVSKKSLHMQGRALDLRVPNRKIETVRRAALDIGRGGVGYYPKSGFVHVDTGHVRQW